MRYFFEDCVKPFIFAIILVITLVFAFVGVIFGICAILESNECKVWGGKYNFSTGCLMEYNDKTLTLADYKRIQVSEITQPITHNIKIKGE